MAIEDSPGSRIVAGCPTINLRPTHKGCIIPYSWAQSFDRWLLALQTLSHIAEWSSIAGMVVSIAGLVYSIRAFWAAKKAKQSADDARRDVRTLVAADRFHQLSSKASDLFSHVELDNFAVAVFLARDLRFEINTAIARWEFLDAETKLRFREASRLAMQIGEFVRSKGQLDVKDKTKVLKKCDLILSVLSGESGKIQASLEGRGES
jgi:hypothetical protein